jgi:predicted nucleotidyltransferase
MKTPSSSSIVKTIQRELPYLRQHFGVEQVALFGSFTRDEATEESDIDLVVALSRPLGFAFFELADYLEAILGRRVDLITASTLELGLSDPRRAHITRNIQESLIYV